MKVLIACEESQSITKEFRNLGHKAFSCDILPCSGGHPEWHYQQDVFVTLFYRFLLHGISKETTSFYLHL